MTLHEFMLLLSRLVLVVGWFTLLALFVAAVGWARESWWAFKRTRRRGPSCSTCLVWKKKQYERCGHCDHYSCYIKA